MKLDKNQQKQLINAIRISAKNRGYKKRQNTIYRAIGAFSAPSVLLKKGEVDLTEKYEEQAKYLVGLVDECSHNFMVKAFLSGYRCFNGTFSIFLINDNFDKIVSSITNF